MSKKNRIIYWIATAWLSLGMLSSGIVQISGMKEEVDMMAHLGYAAYFMVIIGVWKILGVIAILVPKMPIIKEWAYAGFFFTMSGAIISHAVHGDTAMEFFGPGLLLVLTIVSWNFRPADRKTVA